MRLLLSLSMLSVSVINLSRCGKCNTDEDEHRALIQKSIHHTYCVNIDFEISLLRGCVIVSSVFGFSNASEELCEISSETITCHCARNCTEEMTESVENAMSATISGGRLSENRRRCLTGILASWIESRRSRVKRDADDSKATNNSIDDTTAVETTAEVSDLTSTTTTSTTTTVGTSEEISELTSTTAPSTTLSVETSEEASDLTTATSTTTTVSSPSPSTASSTTSSPEIPLTSTITTITLPGSTTSSIVEITTTSTFTSPDTTQSDFSSTTTTTTTTTTATTVEYVSETSTISHSQRPEVAPVTTSTDQPSTTMEPFTTTESFPASTAKESGHSPSSESVPIQQTTATDKSFTTTSSALLPPIETFPATTEQSSTTVEYSPSTESTRSGTSSKTTATEQRFTTGSTEYITRSKSVPSEQTIVMDRSPAESSQPSSSTEPSYSEGSTEDLTSATLSNITSASDEGTDNIDAMLKSLLMHTYMKLFFLLGAISLIMIAQLFLIRYVRSKRRARFNPPVPESPSPQSPQPSKEGVTPGLSQERLSQEKLSQEKLSQERVASKEQAGPSGSQEVVETYPEPEPFYYRFPRRNPSERRSVKGWEWM
ncbi:hypothetical protein V3C99_007036 [Haemonchus contortus]